MRILITTGPAYGHVNPMLPIARAAQREVSELAGALAAAQHVVPGLGIVRQTSRPAFEPRCGLWQVPDLIDELYSATYLDICPPGLQPEGNQVWQSVQPPRPAAGEPATGERLPEALAALPHPQTIHLTLGTVCYETLGVLEMAIAALRELPLNLVVTTGPGTDPTQFGPQPPHVLVEPYIPHTLLLPHCCLVVSHGGAGIMFGALAHGLPQLILPQGADQFWNADACQRIGVALALTPEAFSAEAVAEAAQRLITDPAFTAAARRIQTEINTMPTPAATLTLPTPPP